MIERRMACALKAGKLVYIDDVERGLKCGCTCPACGEALIARKGDIRGHHFAHQAGECATGLETSLHMMAKEILSSAQKLWLPSCILDVNWVKPMYKVFAEQNIQIDHVELEMRVSNIIPDVVVYGKNGEQLFVEIYVTHKVDEAKQQKLREIGVPTLEIDLSKESYYIDREALESILLRNKSVDIKKWLYHPKVDRLVAALVKAANRRDIAYVSGNAIVDCAAKKRHVLGGNYYYANVYVDCRKCRYNLNPMLFGEKKNGILCMARDSGEKRELPLRLPDSENNEIHMPLWALSWKLSDEAKKEREMYYEMDLRAQNANRSYEEKVSFIKRYKLCPQCERQLFYYNSGLFIKCIKCGFVAMVDPQTKEYTMNKDEIAAS